MSIDQFRVALNRRERDEPRASLATNKTDSISSDKMSMVVYVQVSKFDLEGEIMSMVDRGHDIINRSYQERIFIIRFQEFRYGRL